MTIHEAAKISEDLYRRRKERGKRGFSIYDRDPMSFILYVDREVQNNLWNDGPIPDGVCSERVSEKLIEQGMNGDIYLPYKDQLRALTVRGGYEFDELVTSLAKEYAGEFKEAWLESIREALAEDLATFSLIDPKAPKAVVMPPDRGTFRTVSMANADDMLRELDRNPEEPMVISVDGKNPWLYADYTDSHLLVITEPYLLLSAEKDEKIARICESDKLLSGILSQQLRGGAGLGNGL